jgi:plasmid stability protein
MMAYCLRLFLGGGDMKRTQIQLDERTYEKLRRRAFEKGCSVSSYVREVLAYALGTARAKQRLSIGDFKFVGAGRSQQGRLAPVSERHDEALAESLAKEHRR